MKMKGIKSQSSIEFAVLTAFAMMVFIMVVTLFNSNLDDINRERLSSRADDIYTIVSSEIRFAYESPANYSRTFSIPSSVDGYPVTLNCINSGSGQDIVIGLGDIERVYFLDHTITDCDKLGTGSSSIVKVCTVPGVCDVKIM